jgi:hypothetical protein
MLAQSMARVSPQHPAVAHIIIDMVSTLLFYQGYPPRIF